MLKNMTLITLLTSFVFSAWSSTGFARSVYLNGEDVSSSRNQYLKKVNVRIDEHGNVFIEAPHYRVNEENTYTPLSSWVKEQQAPMHQPPGKLPEAAAARGPGVVAPVAGERNPFVDTPASPTEPATDKQSPVAGSDAKLQDKPGQPAGG